MEGDIKTFYLNIMNYSRRNVFPFKGNAEYFGVCCSSPFVIRTIKRVFAWQWKFMVALLCPNNSHIVSRTDSPCRKQQACYQSHIFAYCETTPPPPSPPPPPLSWQRKTFEGIELRSFGLFSFLPRVTNSHQIEKKCWPVLGLLVFTRHIVSKRRRLFIFNCCCCYLFIRSHADRAGL